MVLNPGTVAVIKIDMYLFLWSLQSVGGHRQYMRRNHRSDRGATSGIGGGDALETTESQGTPTKTPRGTDSLSGSSDITKALDSLSTFWFSCLSTGSIHTDPIHLPHLLEP